MPCRKKQDEETHSVKAEKSKCCIDTPSPTSITVQFSFIILVRRHSQKKKAFFPRSAAMGLLSFAALKSPGRLQQLPTHPNPQSQARHSQCNHTALPLPTAYRGTATSATLKFQGIWLNTHLSPVFDTRPALAHVSQSPAPCQAPPLQTRSRLTRELQTSQHPFSHSGKGEQAASVPGRAQTQLLFPSCL